MANRELQKPEEGRREVVRMADSVAEAMLVFDFLPGEAVMERLDDSLVFRFEGGGELVLEDFYSAYDLESVPVFAFDSQTFAGEDFFRAFADDLLPAAGVPLRNAAFHVFDESIELIDGVEEYAELSVSSLSVDSGSPLPFPAGTGGMGEPDALLFSGGAEAQATAAAGNADVFLYHPGNPGYGGEQGIDFLAGLDDRGLKDALGADMFRNIEAFVMDEGLSAPIVNLTELGRYGVTVEAGNVVFDENWTQGSTFANSENIAYVEMNYNHAGEDLQILVQQSILMHNQ